MRKHEREKDREPDDQLRDDVTITDSELLVMAAVLAHHVGLNAVDPDPKVLAHVQQLVRDLDAELDEDLLMRCLKKAQMELLRCQLGEE